MAAMSDSYDAPANMPAVPSPPRPRQPVNLDFTGASRWGVITDGSYLPMMASVEHVPPGSYTLENTMQGLSLKPMKVATDDLIRFPDSPADMILREYETFWDAVPRYEEYGFIHKRGFLFYGPPGTGKTAIMAQMTQQIVQQLKGIVLVATNPFLLRPGLQMIRAVEPLRPLICLLEDMDALTARSDDEQEILQVLDGAANVDHVVYAATTNYIDRLDPRFMDRPSRFDTLVEIGWPNEEQRFAYLMHKDRQAKEDEARQWAAETAEFSFAHLKEIIVAVRVYGQTFDAALERLRKMREREHNDLNRPLGRQEQVFGFGNRERRRA